MIKCFHGSDLYLGSLTLLSDSRQREYSPAIPFNERNNMDCVGGLGNPVLFITNLDTHGALIFRIEGFHFRCKHAAISFQLCAETSFPFTTFAHVSAFASLEKAKIGVFHISFYCEENKTSKESLHQFTYSIDLNLGKFNCWCENKYNIFLCGRGFRIYFSLFYLG